MKPFEIESLTPRIGATIKGLDLSREMSDETFEQLHKAWMDHLVLFFPDQSLSHEQHLALGERFGPLHIHPAAPYVGENQALMEIHAAENSHRNNGEGWHSDVSADLEPPMASILYIKVTPTQGGDTLWANMYEAYEALSKPMKSFLSTLTAVHAADYSGYYGDHPSQRENPSAEHPVIRTHPVTHQKCLFVNSGFTKRIKGVTKAESDALLRLLFEHVKNPNFHCRLQWRPNTIAIWDNRCTQHMAVWDYFPETRSGVRVTVKGDRPR